MKRALSIILVLCLLLSLPVLAAEPEALTCTASAEQISKYGNVYLSLSREELFAAGYAYGDVLRVEFLGQSLELPLCGNYGEVDYGMPGIFARDRDQYVGLAVNMGDFATQYGIAVKTVNEDKTYSWSYPDGVTGPINVEISMAEAGGYYGEYTLRQLTYTDAREDYPQLSDEEFANFRAVTTTGMGTGVLYRTASPVNPQHNRNALADAALRGAGVTVVMNLADDPAGLREYPGYGDSYYSGLQVVALNMGVDTASQEYRAKLAEGLRFFAEHPGVYAVHCTEGKDRTGYVVALLECFMGADIREVTADYMTTFYNYYGIVQGEERYEAVGETIRKALRTAFGTEDLENGDLAALAEEYFRGLGLTEGEISALRRNLSAAPAPQKVEGTVYTILPGDCLWRLAKRFYGKGSDFGRIAAANGIAGPHYRIYPGQTLVIPE